MRRKSGSDARKVLDLISVSCGKRELPFIVPCGVPFGTSVDPSSGLTYPSLKISRPDFEEDPDSAHVQGIPSGRNPFDATVAGSESPPP
jgi:hypothetical protein